MDRWKPGAASGSSDSRKRGKLQPVSEKPPGESSKFKGSILAADLPEAGHRRSIDPNLLVGPLYVPQTSDSRRIKEQLGDITEKLHKTLYSFDEFEDFEHEDPVVAMMRKQIGQVDDKNMRSNLAIFIDQYEDMSSQVTAANRDRDDMLIQLADWFTTDHIDLTQQTNLNKRKRPNIEDDIKTSVDDSEEEFMKESYFSAMTNFEKLKKLQNQIIAADKQGRSTKQLQQKKFNLEKDVVDHFKVMKDMSMQTKKLNVSNDAPWKHAANEIVDMLNNVRGENTEHMAFISKKMQEMVDSLEKQARTIQSLRAELRDKKQIVQRLTDENGELSTDVMLLRNRYTKYEKDLRVAQALIRKLHSQKPIEGGKLEADLPAEIGKTLAESVSKVLSQMSEPIPETKEFSSDPTLLRTQLRDYQEALETLRSEYSRSAEEVDELKIDLEEKRAYIASIETENEKLLKDVKSLKQLRKQSIAAGFTPPAAGFTPPAAGDGHRCDHCKCHITDNEFEEEIESLKKEVAKWQEKCNFFKKCLADTELKLSDAFREISDLRMDREMSTPPPSVQKAHPPSVQKAHPPSVQKAQVKKEQPTQEPKKPEEKGEKGEVTEETPQEKVAKSAAPKPKAKKDIKPRYLEKARTDSPPPPPLPPVEQIDITEHMSNLTQKQTRELKLFRAGDIQGKLNLLTAEIMDFVADIGKMLYQDKDDQSNKVQTMKAFNLESKAPTKKSKDAKDSKNEEAKQMKNMVMFYGQHACAKLIEAYETLSGSLKLQHNEYEAIYRTFKISQQRNYIRREIFMGRLPVAALHQFDREQRKKLREQDSNGAESLLSAYFNISYGGGSMQAGVRQGGHPLHRGNSSVMSIHSDTAEESEARLKTTMHMIRVQRSRSDLDVRDTPVAPYSVGVFGGGLIKERTQIYMPSSMEQPSRENLAGGHKQEMKVGMAVVNKKGLISLTTNDVSNQLPEFSATGEAHRPSHDQGSGKQRSKSLIKRKDLMDHYKAGFKILEDEQIQKHKEEELQKSLGDYTILDLQSKILELTDAKFPRRNVDVPISPSGQRKVPLQMKSEKTVTLPAIKNFNPFSNPT